jgi:predicted amidohydrolase YtcJ
MPTQDEFVDATRAGLRIAAARGVVAIHDKDGWLGAPGIFQRVHERDGLTLRVWQSVPYERLPELAALAVHSGIGDDYLRIGYLKGFMDGTLGSQTAWMLDGSGVTITSGEQLAEIVREGARLGWPVAVHAIGDRANREALDAFESTRDAWAPLGLRHRVEHAQCLAPEDVARFAAIGVACSVQFSHAPSDRDLAERFWPERLAGAYAFRSLWDSGALVANGSDAPVEELDPLAGIRAGVLRTIDERPAWHPEQCLTVEQALTATIVNPPWLSGDERRRGKLLPGYLADLVVLSRDPLDCPPDELESVEVVATMVGGRWVHNPPPWD